MSVSEAISKDGAPVQEYVRSTEGLISHLPHEWELQTAILLTPSEERTMVREPAHAVPDRLAERIGKLRVRVVPYIGCFPSGDVVSFSKPSGETHTAVWVETDGRTDLVLACREADAHDTGFEFLASVAQLAVAKLGPAETEPYARLVEDELRRGVGGEIDKEALDAKQTCLKEKGASKSAALEHYFQVSLTSTLAEYMHGLWHDVQIRIGPEHLPVENLRKRMIMLSEIFPPNTGYDLFARELGGKRG